MHEGHDPRNQLGKVKSVYDYANVHEGAICIMGVRFYEIHNEKIAAVVGMKANRGRGAWVQECGVRYVSRVQVSRSLLASPLSDVATRTKDIKGNQGLSYKSGVADLGLRRTRVTGRPAFWRASMKPVEIKASRGRGVGVRGLVCEPGFKYRGHFLPR